MMKKALQELASAVEKRAAAREQWVQDRAADLRELRALIQNKELNLFEEFNDLLVFRTRLAAASEKVGRTYYKKRDRFTGCTGSTAPVVEVVLIGMAPGDDPSARIRFSYAVDADAYQREAIQVASPGVVSFGREAALDGNCCLPQPYKWSLSCKALDTLCDSVTAIAEADAMSADVKYEQVRNLLAGMQLPPAKITQFIYSNMVADTRAQLRALTDNALEDLRNDV